MTREHVEAFQESLGRCLKSPNFIGDFYDRFQDASDEIRDKFRGTDFAHQNRALADSLYVMAVAAEGGRENVARQDMKRLARRHEEMDIAPWMFDVWLDCVVQAAKRHDPQFSPEVEHAWRETLRPGIEYMRSGKPFEA